MPRGSDGKIDKAEAAYMREVVFKFLLTKTQPNMTCAVSGSNLALTWLSVAHMPPNNVAAITFCIPLYLPSTFPADHMEVIWNEAVQQFGQQPEELREMCPRRPACLVQVLEEFHDQADPVEFASLWIDEKLVAEVRDGCMSC